MAERLPETIDVLHVDDDTELLDMAATLLERENDRFRLTTAATGEAGLERLEAGTFDCVVSDFDMPGMDGLDFLDAVRESYPDLPFVLFTGKGSEEIASEAISAGVTDYLQKGPSTDRYTVLANRIENAVAQYRAERAISRTRERYESLVSRSTDIMILFDEEGCVEYISPAVERILGYDPAEVRGTNGLEYSHPGERDDILDAYEEVLKNPSTVVTVEHRARTADGEWVWMESSFRNLIEEKSVGGIVQYARDATDRIRSRHELQEERDRREALFQNPSDPILEIEFEDETPFIKAVNDAFVEVFGFEPDSVIDRPVSAVLVPEDESARTHHDAITRDVIDGKPVEREVRRMTDDGVREFILRVFPIDIANGDHASYAIYTDISAQKRQERTLEALHGAATEITGDESVTGICERTIEAADQLLDFRMCGLALHDDGWLEPVAVSAEKIEDEFRRMGVDHGIAGKTFETGEPAIVADLHAESDADLGNQAYRAGLSVPVGDHGVFQAVSEEPGAFDQTDLEFAELLLSHTEAALDRLDRERELERYETMVEASGDPVYILDEHGCLQFCNDSFVEMAEYEDSELRGAHVSLFMDEADIEQAESLIQNLLTSDRDRATIEMSVETGSGKRLICESHFALLPSEDGFEGTIGVLRDVTDRKKREQSLARQNQRLDEFASIVGHDLRNPLEVATGALELAREEGDTDRLQTVEDSLQRMESLLDDLLEMARAGEQVRELEPVEIAATAERAWQNVDTSGASITVGEDLTVQADATRLQQLFENLFRNAVEHGGDTVSVRVGTLSDSTGFFVADDGPGIPPEEREAVLASGYSTRREGTGLGLSIVREIVDAHAWTLDVTESDAGGARFEIADLDG